MKLFLSSLILLLFINACDPCYDCDSVTFEPTVSFVFINQDSIQSIDDSLAVFTFNESMLTFAINSLTDLRTDLQHIQDSIDKGGNLTQEKMAIEMMINQQQADSLLFATKNKDVATITSTLNTIKSSINSGLIHVSQIEIIENSFITSYIDSATHWRVPLAYDKSFKQYKVTIADFSEVIELDYDLIQTVDDERTVLVRAENIRVVDKTYIAIDSLITNCEEKCIDGETVFTFYF